MPHVLVIGAILSLIASAGEAQSLRNRHLQDNVTQQIVGGTDAEAMEFPGFVHNWACGGSLVAADMVLTAAHCQNDFQYGGLVFVGSNVFNGLSDGAERKMIVSDMIINPRFSRQTNFNDFMLFKIEAVESTNLTPFQLNRNENTPSEGDTLTVIGVGYTSYKAYRPDYLQKVDIGYLSQSQCQAVYGSYMVGDLMFCAGDWDGGIDSCGGDSGGPALNQDGEIVGVVSWGVQCAKAGYPGMYARVTSEIQWILDTICEYTDTEPEFCLEYSSTTPSYVSSASDVVVVQQTVGSGSVRRRKLDE